jgi:hypothetical protein
MAGSTTEEIPCQTTDHAKKMAILLAGPSGEDPPEGRRRQTGGKPARSRRQSPSSKNTTLQRKKPKSSRARYPTPAQSQGASRLASLPVLTDKNRPQSPPVDNRSSCGQLAEPATCGNHDQR